MKKIRTPFLNRKNEKGQAMVSGLIFLLLSFLCFAYFLYASECFLRGYSNTEKAREEVLKKAAIAANTINQIAQNNKSILAALSVAENAFAQAAEAGLYIGFKQPYWETYGSLKSDFENEEYFLSEISKETIDSLYKSFALQSARGLFIAKALSEKNKILVYSLPLSISQYFKQSSNAQVFCLALESQKRHYKKPGFYNIPGIKHLYHFYLEKEGCTIKHTQGITGYIDKSLPLLFSNKKEALHDKILSYEDFDKINSNVQYGIWYVNFNESPEFLNSLLFTAQSRVSSVNTKFTHISSFLNKIRFFKDLHLTETKILSGYSKNISAKITHPNFETNSHNSFLNSFFKSHWTPVIAEETNKNE